VEFHSPKGEQIVDTEQAEVTAVETPEETFQRAYLQVRGELAANILQRITVLLGEASVDVLGFLLAAGGLLTTSDTHAQTH